VVALQKALVDEVVAEHGEIQPIEGHLRVDSRRHEAQSSQMLEEPSEHRRL
jgi:hypothetical protein